MSLGSFLLDLFLPSLCLSCDRWGEALCGSCIRQFKKYQPLICPSCLKSSSKGKPHLKCSSFIDQLHIVWKYRNPLQSVIHQIKYQYYYSAIKPLTASIVRELRGDSYKMPIEMIVLPVPLHKQRYRERGFNQAALLGKLLAKSAHLAYSEKILLRVKNNNHQANLTALERKKNVKGIFALNPKLLKLANKPLKGKSFLLVDDVWTTGSTMQACAKELKRCGAKEVWGLAVAG